MRASTFWALHILGAGTPHCHITEGTAFSWKASQTDLSPSCYRTNFQVFSQVLSTFLFRRKKRTLTPESHLLEISVWNEGREKCFSLEGDNHFTCNSVQISHRFPLLSPLIMVLTTSLFLAQIWLQFHLFLSFWQTTEQFIQSHKSSQVWYTIEI